MIRNNTPNHIHGLFSTSPSSLCSSSYLKNELQSSSKQIHNDMPIDAINPISNLNTESTHSNHIPILSSKQNHHPHSQHSSTKMSTSTSSIVKQLIHNRILYHASCSKEGSNKTNRKVNQDHLFEISCFNEECADALFGVFDGHGEVGHEVSAYVSHEIPRRLHEKHKLLYERPKEILKDTFNDVNAYLKSCGVNCIFSGSTGIVCYLQGMHLYTCNVGDSRAVLARCNANPPTLDDNFKAIPLSIDQKPDRPDERERILSAHGRIAPHKMSNGEEYGPSRVWLPNSDVPGLSMSRSFGDLVVSAFGVISEPELHERQIDEFDRFIILATDGIWDIFSNQDAVNIVANVIGTCPTPESIELAAATLVMEASNKWNSNSTIVDDITAIIVYFHNL